MGGDSCMDSREVFHSSWRWSGMARVAGGGRGPAWEQTYDVMMSNSTLLQPACELLEH